MNDHFYFNDNVSFIRIKYVFFTISMIMICYYIIKFLYKKNFIFFYTYIYTRIQLYHAASTALFMP